MDDNGRNNFKTVLSMNHVYDILTYLYTHDNVKITDLHCIATNHPALQTAVMKMIGAGLMTMEHRNLPKTTCTLELTDFGREVAAPANMAREVYLRKMSEK